MRRRIYVAVFGDGTEKEGMPVRVLLRFLGPGEPNDRRPRWKRKRKARARRRAARAQKRHMRKRAERGRR